MGAGIEQSIFGQGTGCYQPHHFPAHNRLGTTFFGLSRVFRLFADRHAKPFADQTLQIGICGMDRDTAHGNVFPQMLAPFGECNIERGRSGDGVIKKQLVKIAHPVEKQTICLARLQFQILRHHRRDGGRFVV